MCSVMLRLKLPFIISLSDLVYSNCHRIKTFLYSLRTTIVDNINAEHWFGSKNTINIVMFFSTWMSSHTQYFSIPSLLKDC